jgi:zinc protease
MIRLLPFVTVLSLITLLPNASQASEKVLSDPYENVRSLTMPNGIKVVLAPSKEAKTFQIKVRVNGGIFNEEQGKAGTAHLLEHYLFTDAKFEKNMTYLEVIKEKGGSGNAWTSTKETVYHATVPGELAPWLVGTFGNLLFQKTFDESRVQQAKGPVFLEIGRPSVFDYLTQALQSLWPDFARPEDFWQTEFGLRDPMRKTSADKIQTEALTSGDLKRFYDREYYPGNMTVFLAGNFQEPELLSLLEGDHWNEPKREGFGWVDPTPKARRGDYYRSEVTSGVPKIEIGTKVAGISLVDELVGRAYTDYLSHRLMKELRNVRGETYTVVPKIDFKKGFGYMSVEFEAPQSDYRTNLKYVRDLIDQETRRGQFTRAMFDEAIDLTLKGYRRMDHDTSSMMYMADRIDHIERDYDFKNGHQTDYQVVKGLTYEDFNRRLNHLFAGDMKVEDLEEPPVFFRFESLVLMILAFGFWMRVSRIVFAKKFAHDELRWVRKVSYPPAYCLQFTATIFVLILSSVLYGGVAVLWMRTNFLQRSFLISDYLFTIIWLGMVLFSAQFVFARFGRKVMVVGDSLWIKSLGYFSATLKLDEIEKIESSSPFAMVFAPRSWWQIKYRYYYYDPCFWRKGLLIRLKSGRAFFVGVRSAEEALKEVQAILEKHNVAQRQGLESSIAA